eukprot:s444_g23.t2
MDPLQFGIFEMFRGCQPAASCTLAVNFVAAGAFAPGAAEVLRQEGHWQRRVQILEMLRSPGGLTEPWNYFECFHHPARTYGLQNEQCAQGSGMCSAVMQSALEFRLKHFKSCLPSRCSLGEDARRVRQWETAMHLWPYMRLVGAEADSGFWNMLISASGRGGAWEKSMKLERILLLHRVAPTEISVSAAVSACGGAKEWHQALRVFQGVPAMLSDDVFGAAIGACEVAQHWTRAVQLLQEMNLHALKHDVVKVSSVVSACQGQWPVALDLLHELKVKSFIIHAATLSACSAALQWLQCLQVLEDMRDSEIRGDFVLLCDVVTACTESGHAVPALLDEVLPISRVVSRAIMNAGRFGRLLQLSGVRHQVSLATVLQQSENEETSTFTHSIKWSWNGKEVVEEGKHRSKRGAKNEAARSVLKQVAADEAERLDPKHNGQIAQWVIGDITENLEATLEVKEDKPEADQDVPRAGGKTHICTFTCPQIEGEFVATGSGKATADSRRKAFAALYETLPPSLEEVYIQLVTQKISPKKSQKEQAHQAAPSMSRHRMGEINVMHNSVVQKLNIEATKTYKATKQGSTECTLTWRFYGADGLKTEVVSAVAHSKPAAKALAHEQMLIQQGHIPHLTEEQVKQRKEIHLALEEQRIQDACQKAITLMEVADINSWSSFLPSVMRAVLGEGDRAQLHELLDAILRIQENGLPPDLWEALLDEASFAIRHYFMALPALRELGGFPLADAFPGEQEKEYFKRFRHLLALERHGGLMSGIQTYELDPKAACSVPTADRISVTSPPDRNVLELVEGARPLRATDLVLLVPSEADEIQDESQEMGNSTAWQHPEAWLGSVTSIQGNSRLDEEVRINIRRMSDFASDVELREGSGQRPSPITIGREFRLYFLAMETPMSRQLSALRCVTQVQLPTWSDNFEGRKSSYQYLEAVSRMIVSAPGEALELAQGPARGGLSHELAQQNLEMLSGQHSLIAALTPSQNGAVLKALQQRLSLVQGPPGTGKTHVACAILAAWASIYCSLGERILAVADSNVAADNIYVRLQKMGIECTRVGQGKEVDTPSGDAMYREVQRAKIVVATCIGSGMDVLTNKNAGGFQRVLVDECTQACEPSVLVPLGRQCEQVVLIGDHAQLPATVLSKAAQNEGLGLSLFERMVTSTGLEPTLLLEQRRMHSSIADFPNQMFYSGQLMNAANDSALEAVPGFAWPNPDCRVAFVDVSSGVIEGRRGFSAYNTAEAEAVASVLENIINAGYPPDQIVVLTAYLAQKQELQRAIRDRGLGRYLTSCHVDTIDGYQGMEQGLVLFSATRNNESNALGFLADNRRMNVMLTRAKQGLIVFGNQGTLQNSESIQSKWPAWLQWVEERNASITVEQLQSRQADATVRSRPSTDHQDHQSVARAGLADDVLQEDTPQLAQPAGSPTPGKPQPPQQAPTPWQQVYSSEYKAYYYWNKDTNVTQWEEPPSFMSASD